MAIYVCEGNVRGRCNHLHKSLVTAVRCLRKDRAGCASQSNGSYSDRDIYELVDGYARELSVADVDLLNQAFELTEDE